jgi:tyrosyl-DNA phosphodiesterase-1
MEKDFVETLSWVITEMQPKGFNLLNEMKIDLGDYSFKGIDVVLIPSLPGRFKGQYLDKVGIGKVKKIMKNCSIHFKKPIMTYNCTSLGKVDEKLIR